MLRGKAARILAILSLLTASPMVWAGTRYEVKGEATVEVMPDVATILIPLYLRSDDAADATAQLNTASSNILRQLKTAGVPDRAIDFGEQSDAIKLRDDIPGPRYVAVQHLLVQVVDFSILPKLAQIATESGNKDWSVSYDISGRAKFGKTVVEAALADARRKADDYAKTRGLTDVRLMKTEHRRACLPGRDGLPVVCETDGEKPADQQIVITARKREGPRTDFSVPVPKPQTLTATVDATFELR